jgi:hypothetical protein
VMVRNSACERPGLGCEWLAVHNVFNALFKMDGSRCTPKCNGTRQTVRLLQPKGTQKWKTNTRTLGVLFLLER